MREIVREKEREITYLARFINEQQRPAICERGIVFAALPVIAGPTLELRAARTCSLLACRVADPLLLVSITNWFRR